MMKNKSFGSVFIEELQSVVHIPPASMNDIEAKKEYWWNANHYDPYGEFDSPPHIGQVKLHDFMADPSVKVIVVRAGKRAGKSTCAAAEGLVALAGGAVVWVLSATLELCDAIFQEMWKPAVEREIIPVLSRSKERRNARFKNGAELMAKSWGEGLDSIEAKRADVMLIDEGQKLTQAAWELAYARTLDNNGKIIIVGSEQENSEFFDDICDQAGENDSPRKRHNWRFVQFSTLDNPHISREAIEDSAEVLTNYEGLIHGKRRPNFTRVFPEFRPEIHAAKRVKYIEGYPVHLWIDPGRRWYAVTPVQIVHRRGVGEIIRVFDEVYGFQMTNYKMIEECKSRAWWPDVTDIVIDVAGNQHRTGGDGLSDIEEWDHWTGIAPRAQRVGIRDGITRIKGVLEDSTGRPRIFYDKDNCPNFMAEFKAHRYELPRHSLDGRPHKELPRDDNNHHIKSLAYGITDRWGVAGIEGDGIQLPPPIVPGRHVSPEYDPLDRKPRKNDLWTPSGYDSVSTALNRHKRMYYR